jgi:hypothetical protein
MRNPLKKYSIRRLFRISLKMMKLKLALLYNNNNNKKIIIMYAKRLLLLLIIMYLIPLIVIIRNIAQIIIGIKFPLLKLIKEKVNLIRVELLIYILIV